MKATIKSPISNWVVHSLVWVHIGGGVWDFIDNKNDGVVQPTTMIALAFAMTLLNAGISYRGASLLSLLVHTLEAVDRYCRKDGDILWGHENLTKHIAWMTVAIVLILACRHHRPLDKHGLPPGAILSFCFEKPGVVQSTTTSLNCWEHEYDEMHSEDAQESRRMTDEIWIRAGHDLDSPERLVVATASGEPDESVHHDKRPSSPLTTTTTLTTPTSSPPSTPARKIADLVNRVAHALPEKAIDHSTMDEKPKKQPPLSPAEPLIVGEECITTVDPILTNASVEESTALNNDSLLPTLREARGLIDEILAKRPRGKEKVN